MKNAVNWFEIYVEDMDRAKDFYSKVFDKEMMELPGPGDGRMVAFPWEDGAEFATGALVKSPNAGPGVGGTTVYFHCEDCAVESGRVEASGGKLLNPKFSIGEHGFCAIFQDTEGNVVGMHSRQ